MRSLEVIVVDEGGEPALCAGEFAVPGVVEALDAHFQRLEPLFDLVAIGVFELTAQIRPRESGQIVEALNQQLRLREVVPLFQLRQERRGGGLMI